MPRQVWSAGGEILPVGDDGYQESKCVGALISLWHVKICESYIVFLGDALSC
jgi:hypothetical protein